MGSPKVANFEIVWNARISGVTAGTAVGLFLVYNGADYIPATTANLALFTEVRGCIYAIPSSTTAIIQQVGDVDASVTGCTNAAFGYAVLNSTGYAVWAAATAPGATVVGTFEGTMLRLSLSGTGASSATSANGVQVISPLDFGAVGNGIADDTVGFQTAWTAINDAGQYLQANYQFYITPLPAGRQYILTDTITMSDDTASKAAGVEITGGTNTPNISYGGALIRWKKPNVAVSAATVTVSAVADTDPSSGTNNRRPTKAAVTLGGASIAAIAASVSVGDQFYCTASSYGDFLGPHTVRAVTASTVTVGSWDTAGSYPASMTGFSMYRKDYMFRAHGRELSFSNFSVEVYLASAYLQAVVETNESPNPGSTAVSANHFRNIIASAPTGGLNHLVDVAPEYLPLVGNNNYILDGGTGLPLPCHANNNDFFLLDNCQLSANADGYVLHSENVTGQSRGHIVRNCGNVNGDNGIIGTGEWSTGGRQGSIAGTVEMAVGGNTTGTLFKSGTAQAGNLFYYPHLEGVARLLKMNLYAASSIQPVMVVGGYYNLAGIGTGKVQSPFIDVSNCTMQIIGASFSMSENSDVVGGINWFRFWASTPSLTLIGCTLPHENMLNGGVQFKYGTVTGGYAKLTMIGCRAYDTNTSTTYEIKNVFNKTITADYNAEYSGGNELTLVSGLSATAVPNVNFIGTATVTGAATTATWTFGSAETSATKLYGWAVPIASTGGPAAGSNRVLTCVVNTTTAVVTVEVAPGGAATVTFAIFLARGL